MAISECVAIIKDLSISFGALVAAFIGIQGFSEWKEQLKGKSQYELAKEILRSVYEVREAFKIVRYPFLMDEEYPEEFRERINRLNCDEKYQSHLYLYQNRWDKIQQAFLKLETKNLEGLVEFNTDEKNIIEGLRRCKYKLNNAIHRYVQQVKYPHKQNTPIDNQYEIDCVLNHQTDDDPFYKEIDAGIKPFEDWLRPYINLKK